MKKLTKEVMQEYATQKRGKFLSSIYSGNKIRHEWECSEGHTWFATPDNVRNSGNWCPECRDRQPITLNQLKDIAKSKNGRCLATSYKNPDEKLLWECSEGHEWRASTRNIKYNDTWCPEGAGTSPLKIQDMHDLARGRGGKCLSQEIVNGATPLKWECQYRHIWEAIPNSVKRGSWCGKCAGNVPLDIEDLRSLAQERGGKLITSVYQNARTPMEWECSEGHPWFQRADNIKNLDQWCPHCQINLSEEKVRTAFEQLTYKKFPKSRPKWLATQGSGRLELDGFNSDLALAFEYNGIQHYRKMPFLQPTDESLRKSQERDELKKIRCQEQNVALLVITYKDDLLNLKQLIQDRLSSYSYLTTYFDFNIELDLSQAWGNNEKIVEMRELAEVRGGKCISRVYINTDSKLEWQCCEGHHWFATPYNIKQQRTWCPKCRLTKESAN